MNSSNDSVKAKSAAATIDGRINGRVMAPNVVHGPAPRSREASLERPVEGFEPRPHHRRHEGDVEHDMGEHDRVEAER